MGKSGLLNKVSRLVLVVVSMATPARVTAQAVMSAARQADELFHADITANHVTFAIPGAQIGRVLLLVTRIASSPPGGFAGTAVSARMVRIDTVSAHVILREEHFGLWSDSTSPVSAAIANAQSPANIAALPIRESSGGVIVVDATPLFLNPPPELGPGGNVRGALDASRSFLKSARAFPGNVEVEAELTYSNPSPLPANSPAWVPQPINAASTVALHWSFLALPSRPMRSRIANSRVGFFFDSATSFSNVDGIVSGHRVIRRWRLEKTQPGTAVSDVTHPITFYIDRSTPEKWVPWIIRGVEAWRPAFEAAGFRNAITARRAPTLEEDPAWSPDDARWSIIRWIPSTIEDASGQTITDPRTGEILNAQVLVYQNVLKLDRDAFVAQLIGVRKEAQHLPLPDSILGQLLAATITHEIGHTLGLGHNFKASSQYPADSLRNVSFLMRNGFTPSIMDYVRFNYLVQPEDNIPLHELVPRVGPYDRFAIKWGYGNPSSGSASDEHAFLDGLLAEQERNPFLLYTALGGFGADAAEQAEAVGDGDVIASTTLGLRNLERGSMLLASIDASADDIRAIHQRMLDQWRQELGHVINQIGGARAIDAAGNPSSGPRFVPLTASAGRQAMAFLDRQQLVPPAALVSPAIFRRYESFGSDERILAEQRILLRQLLNDDRMERLEEYSTLDAADAYGLSEYIPALRHIVWRELDGTGPVHVSAVRRGLQREFLSIVEDKLNRPNTDPILRQGQFGFQQFPAPVTKRTAAQEVLAREMARLRDDLRTRAPLAADQATRDHLASALSLLDAREDGVSEK